MYFAQDIDKMLIALTTALLTDPDQATEPGADYAAFRRGVEALDLAIRMNCGIVRWNTVSESTERRPVRRGGV